MYLIQSFGAFCAVFSTVALFTVKAGRKRSGGEIGLYVHRWDRQAST